MKKNPWLIIAVVQFFVIISLMSCSNNPLGVQEAGADPQQTPIAADKVMVNLSKTNMRDGARADEEISLQDYVNQTEPDIEDFVPGKTWNVVYKIYTGATKNGYITLNNDYTYSCDVNGGYIIYNNWQDDPRNTITPIDYKINNNILEFKYTFENGIDPIVTVYSYVDFTDIKTNKLRTPHASFFGRGPAILTPQE